MSKRRSILGSVIKVFFVTCFSILGIFVAFLVIGLVLDTMPVRPEQPTIKHFYSPKILPDALGKRKLAKRDAPIILKLDIVGFIGSEYFNKETISQQLVESREGVFKGKRVKAIVLNINSPGGSVIDMTSIYTSIERYKNYYGVPVYAFVDGLCLSGGMYIASVADKIFAGESSIIGSVGVLLPTFLNYSETLDKLGIKAKTITSGKDKDVMNPLRPWKEGEEILLQEITDHSYQNFVDKLVARRPNLTREKLIEELGAHFWPATVAKKHGFIDDYACDLRDVLKTVVKDLKIDERNYQVIALERKYRLSEIFGAQLSLLQGKMTHRVEFDPHSIGGVSSVNP